MRSSAQAEKRERSFGCSSNDGDARQVAANLAVPALRFAAAVSPVVSDVPQLA